MIRRSRTVLVTLSASLTLISACDGGERSRTSDEFAADSALAADLALANRDTLLVDSIGAYRPMVTDDSLEADPSSMAGRSTAPVTAPSPASVPAARPSSPPPAAAPAAAPSPSRPATSSNTKAAARLTGRSACSSPTLENQSECVRVLLPEADARLNRVYRALITEMRRQEGVPARAKDPASVQRLRVAQRAWLVRRDTECRRRGKGKEGPLWARPRVRCLGEMANRRANELADQFSRLTAN